MDNGDSLGIDGYLVNLSVGARGCFLSHLAILKRAMEDRLSNVLIIEDDLAISERLKTNHAVLIDRLQQNR